MKYPQTVEVLSARIRQHYPNAADQLEAADKLLFKQGIYHDIQFPAYLLWMLEQLDGFEDRETAGRWLGWAGAKMDGITVLNITTLQDVRNLVRADKLTQTENNPTPLGKKKSKKQKGVPRGNPRNS